MIAVDGMYMTIDNVSRGETLNHARSNHALYKKPIQTNSSTHTKQENKANIDYNQLIDQVEKGLKLNAESVQRRTSDKQDSEKQNESRELHLLVDEESGQLAIEIYQQDSKELIREINHQQIVDLIREQQDHRGLVINLKV